MLRRITLSLALAACIGVASGQTVSNLAWSLVAPHSVPSVEWSANGSYVVLTTDSDIEVLNGKTFALLWSHYIGGAEPTIAATYGSDRAHINSASNGVWARSGPNNTFTEFNIGTGGVTLTHTFTDWPATPGGYLLAQAGTELVAYNISDSAGAYTYTYRIYSTPTFKLVATGSLTHSDSGGLSSVTIPSGVRTGGTSGKIDVACFFNQGVYTSTGTAFTNPAPAAGEEAWTVGIDASGGLIQAVVSSPTTSPSVIGAQRIAPAGTTTWSSSSFTFPNPALGPTPPIASTTVGDVAMEASGNSITAFNYLTGAEPLWTDQIINNTGSNLAAYTFQNTSVNPTTGNLLLVTGTANFAIASMNSYLASATALGSPVAEPGIIYGVADVAPVPSGGLLVDSAGGYFADVAAAGTTSWSINDSTAGHPSASPAGDLGALITANNVEIFNLASATLNAEFSDSKTPVSTAWVSESEFIVVNSDATWQLVSLSSGSTSVVQTYPASIAGAYTITSDGHWVIGYMGGNLNAFDLTATSNTTPYVTAYSAYPTSANTARFVASTNGNAVFASLESTGSGLQWSVYAISEVTGSTYGTVSLKTKYSYTAPFTISSGAEMEGDISGDFKVATFFVSNPALATTGIPTSELAIVRTSDGRVLSTYDNDFAFLASLRFSANRSVLYVVQGGGEPDQGLTADETGSQDVLTLEVPEWILSAAFNPVSTPSGLTSVLTVTLSAPTFARQNVNLTTTGGTVPATLAVLAGASSGTATVTAPITATTTSITVSANLTGDTDPAVSATLTVTAPVLKSVGFTPATITAGASSSGQVVLTGYTPSAITVDLSDSLATMTVPSSVTIAADARSASFTVSTVASSTSNTTTFSASWNGTTVTTSLPVTQTLISSMVLDSTTTTGGNAMGLTITINEPAPTGGFSIGLKSSNAAVTVPTTVTIPAGQTTLEVDLSTVPVKSATAVTITGTLGTKSLGTTLTVEPPTVVAASFEQHAVIGGTPALYDVLLSGATASSTVVTLASTSTRLTVPASATFTAGSSFETFSFPSINGADISVTVTVTFNGTNANDSVTIYPQN